MDLRSLAQLVPGSHFLSELKAQARCVLPGHPDSDQSLLLRQNGDRLTVGCYGGLGHTSEALLTALHLTRADLIVSRPASQESPSLPVTAPAAAVSTNGAPNGALPAANGLMLPRDLGTWRLKLGYIVKGALDAVPMDSRELIASGPRDRIVELIVTQARELIGEHDSRVWPLPAEMSETEVDEEIDKLASRAVTVFQDAYLPATTNGSGLPATEENLSELILCESADQAIVSNAEYLSRPAIVDKLYYIRHLPLGVGGKHEGKTTATRTEALAIATGQPVYGRTTTQTPVIYAASDDEYPTTRMELLRMGWTKEVPLTLIRISPDAAGNPEMVLRALAELALQKDAHFIVLDMLFDFIRVADEIKYAHTREAVRYVQNLADQIGGCVKATHHTPKWMPDAATAAKAALGSQGLVARFSPVLLSRMWVEGQLYTIESTMTRDPRGVPIPPTCVIRDEHGWAQGTDPFRSWMKWKLYADRILGLFEGGESKEYTVTGVARDLLINRPEAQNALFQLSRHDDSPLERWKPKPGGAYKYRLRGESLFGASPKN